jgi:hypothetical protein
VDVKIQNETLNGVKDMHAPIQVRGLDVTQSFRLAGAENDQVRGDKVIALAANDVAHLDVLPLSSFKHGLPGENFDSPRIQFGIRLVTFLETRLVSVRKKKGCGAEMQ